MRRSIDDARDEHEPGAELPPTSWAISLTDDCEDCGPGAPRVVLTLEELGRPGAGLVAHLGPDAARRLRGAIAAALREVGEPPDA